MIKKTLSIIGLTAVGSIGMSSGLVHAADEPASKIDNNSDKTTTDSKEKVETKDKTVTAKDITEERILNETKELAEKLDYTKKVENFDVVTLNKNVSTALDLLKSSNLTDVTKVDEKIKVEAQKEKEDAEKQEQAKKQEQVKQQVQQAPTQTITQSTTQNANISSSVAESSVDTSATVTSGTKGAAIYQAALSQIGRYQDCTMLVTNALKSVGINFHDWPSGYFSLGTVVPPSQAQPGDLIYYANGGTGLAHIAVYAGNGQAIHGGWLGNQTVLNSANVGSGPTFIRVR